MGNPLANMFLCVRGCWQAPDQFVLGKLEGIGNTLTNTGTVLQELLTTLANSTYL
jgi:hypothetical protein